MRPNYISVNNFADLVGVSRSTVELWIRSGKYPLHSNPDGKRVFHLEEIKSVPEIAAILSTQWKEEIKTTPTHNYTSAELFAGGGGLALGMEKAGFKHLLLNEFDHNACETLRTNRPKWNIIEGDIHDIDFTPFKGKIDFLSGGFPCQAFHTPESVLALKKPVELYFLN